MVRHAETEIEARSETCSASKSSPMHFRHG